MPKSRTTLTVEIIDQATKLFNMHNWKIDNTGSFGRFCNALSLLSIEQQNCLLDISRNFLKVDPTEYHYYTKQAIAAIDEKRINSFTKIYVLALSVVEQKIESKKPYEERKKIGRSSEFIAYPFNDSNLQDLPNFKK